MRVVLTDRDTIPEWLYPGSWPDRQTSPEDALETTAFSPSDLDALWTVLDADAARTTPTLLQEGFEDVGIPHDAPGWVERIHPALLASLLGVPAHDRWRVARDWATSESGRRPNEQRLAELKKFLNDLCALAARCGVERMLVILPDGA